MKVLLLLNRTDGQHLAAEMIFRNYYKDATITVKDLAGVTTGALTTYIGTLTAGTYDKVHVCVATSESGGTGLVSFDQMALLLSLIHPDVLEGVTQTPTDGVAVAPQSNATATNIILKSDSSAVDDIYNGMIIRVDVGALGTTFLYRYIKDYTGSSNTAVVNTTTTAVTTTDKYNIFHAIVPGGPLVTHVSATAAYRIFVSLYANCQVPRLIDELEAATDEYVSTATADSVANTNDIGSLTKDTTWTAGEFNDGTYYVGIRSATTGMGQVRRIVSNTVSVLTLDAPWDPLPTGTIVYEITKDRWRCLNDYFLKYAFRFKYTSGFTQAKLDEFVRLIDINNTLSSTTRYTFQDLELLEAYHDLGELIMVSLGRGIAS